MNKVTAFLLLSLTANQGSVWGQVPPIKIRPVISFAGGAVTLKAPQDWQTWELPAGREIRLVLTPQNAEPDRGLTDGVWLCFHHPAVSNPAVPIQKRMERRFGQVVGTTSKKTSAKPIQLREANGLQIEFARKTSTGEYSGVHIMADNKWGTIEILAVAPASQYGKRKLINQTILNSIRFAQPKSTEAGPTQATPVLPIAGYWKAFRSQMKLQVNGNVTVVVDKATRLSTAAANDAASQLPTQLQGTFQAKNDVLYVTWADGSQLNIRWRLKGQLLLLTDHEGRTVSLRRLVH